jgi:hypothetical protein
VALFDVLVFLFDQVKLATYIYCIFRHKAIAWATCGSYEKGGKEDYTRMNFLTV